MARQFNSKPQNHGLVGNLNENGYKNCKFKLEYPPALNGNNLNPKVTQLPKERHLRLGNLNYIQNPTPKRKIKFQCHYEELKRRSELRRKKIIQKLKKIYKIDVDGLNEDAKREIIKRTENIEREKREREKRKVERSMIILTRLLEEQKYKNRERKAFHPPWRKTVKNAPLVEKKRTEVETKICFSEMRTKKSVIQTSTSNGKAARITESLTKESIPTTVSSSLLPPEREEECTEEDKSSVLPESVELKTSQDRLQSSAEKLKKKPRAPLERCLECTPRKVVFQDYEKNKVYLQDVKITNVSCQVIHFRYLGIIVHTKTETRFPIGVAVRDSAKLRPGLSCSTKIRLCSQDDTKKMECSVVYETRRPKAPLQHCWFFVPVECIPVQAVVKVSPLKITFPTLSWFEATTLANAKPLCKSLRIENFGGKACSCKISKIICETDVSEQNVEEEEEEGEGEEEYFRDGGHNNSEVNNQSKAGSLSNSNEEYYGESFPTWEFENFAKLLFDEIFENVFETFRFCPKFHIEIPPHSIVHAQVRFIPHYKGFHHETYIVQFDGCENCEEQTVELVGDVKKLLLRAEPHVIDLKTCIANSGVYSATFKVFNDSKGPQWVLLKLPSSIKKHAHVYPKATVISPFGFSDFSVRFYPRITLARDAVRYYREDTQILEFPVFIHPGNIGSCKREYIKIYVLALITDYCLQLSPSVIDYGHVSTLETVRTELELTNHSLTPQEYGFLNLPKGVRVEPNMGFGVILPKESIRLYLLYSPEDDFLDCGENQKVDQFLVTVTSIAKYGGFREKPEPWAESVKSLDVIWGEDQGYGFPFIEGNPVFDYEGEEEFEECEENSSIEGEELCLKIYEKENKIREYLKQDDESETSSTKKFSSQDESQSSKQNEVPDLEDSLPGESAGLEVRRRMCALKKDLHIVTCLAIVVKPRCRLSDSVIQLPATPCSSFSLYRFRLNCSGEKGDGDCMCRYEKALRKVEDKTRLRIAFEFQYVCPHIKLEPESGFLKPGDSIPITVVYKPEPPAREESGMKKEETTPESKVEKEFASESSSGVKSKSKKIRPKAKASIKPSESVVNAASQEFKNSDYFTGEKGLGKLITPFVVQTKVQCVVKVTRCSDSTESTEIHEMLLICPVINPNFVYLGNSQEIKFDKVFVGMKSKIIFQIQNVSLERISPSVTFLNPHGPFYCPAGIRNVEVDPEHIWRQPLTFEPSSGKGIEKQFFEIYCGSTNIFLTVSGEGIQPDCRINPNFACCLIETKPGNTDELKLEVENQSPAGLNLTLQTIFLKILPNFEKPVNPEEDTKVRKEKINQKEEVKEKKKAKRLSNQNVKFWEEIPEAISLMIEENSEDYVEDGKVKIFALLGANENNAFAVPPGGKQQIRVVFTPPPQKTVGAYAIQYGLMLERASLLKKIIVIGRNSVEK